VLVVCVETTDTQIANLCTIVMKCRRRQFASHGRHGLQQVHLHTRAGWLIPVLPLLCSHHPSPPLVRVVFDSACLVDCPRCSTCNLFGMGVADGIYMWRKLGIDSGEMSRTLMEKCREKIAGGTEDVFKGRQGLSSRIRGCACVAACWISASAVPAPGELTKCSLLVLFYLHCIEGRSGLNPSMHNTQQGAPAQPVHAFNYGNSYESCKVP